MSIHSPDRRHLPRGTNTYRRCRASQRQAIVQAFHDHDQRNSNATGKAENRCIRCCKYMDEATRGISKSEVGLYTRNFGLCRLSKRGSTFARHPISCDPPLGLGSPSGVVERLIDLCSLIFSLIRMVYETSPSSALIRTVCWDR